MMLAVPIVNIPTFGVVENGWAPRALVYLATIVLDRRW